MSPNRRYGALEARVRALTAQGLRRSLRPLEPVDSTRVRHADRTLTVFCSNDYLGLAQHPAVREAAKGAGSGSARLVSGDRPIHRALEARLSTLYGRPATLFSSGYHANLALFSTVLTREMTVASDALNHASIIDGIRLSHAARHIQPHGDPHLPDGIDLVALEGLYSMDGDVPALRTYSGSHWLSVDEAHAFGCLGPQGKGAAAAQGVEPDFLVGTLGKAAGTYGAFIVGPQALRDLLLSRGRSFIFTTGLPETIAHQAMAGLELAIAGDNLRTRLRENAQRLRRGLTDLGLDVRGSHHVVPVVLGERTMQIADGLLERGFLAVGIRPPTVPAGSERIRFTVSAAHTEPQIDGLLNAVEQLAAR